MNDTKIKDSETLMETGVLSEPRAGHSCRVGTRPKQTHRAAGWSARQGLQVSCPSSAHQNYSVLCILTSFLYTFLLIVLK